MQEDFRYSPKLPNLDTTLNLDMSIPSMSPRDSCVGACKHKWKGPTLPAMHMPD